MADTEAPTAKGWYQYDAQTERYWDGSDWTTRERAKKGAAPPMPGKLQPSDKPLSLEERRAILNQQVTYKASQYKARVLSQSDTEAALLSGKKVNHILHLILSVLTFGLWIIPWIIIAATGGEKQILLTVDEYGQVTQRGP